MIIISQRIVEAYIGEYASGKSEVAVNRAISLLEGKRKVTLVDLDLVEPFYTLRPIKKKLMEIGLDVIAWETKETFGLGEAGSILKPEMRWALKRPGDVILDIGYGVEGAKILNLIEGLADEANFDIYVVINIGRPMTSSVEDIVQYVKDLKPVSGLINNSHLGNETTVEFVQEGAKIVSKAAEILGIPVVATYMLKKLQSEMNSDKDIEGNPIKYIDRFMVNTFW